MVISSDIRLVGGEWVAAINAYSNIFTSKTNYQVYLLSTAIGIMYDEQVDLSGTKSDDNPPSVPRNVFNRNNSPFDIMYQTAILTSKNVDLSENERIDLAFDDKEADVSKIEFLTKFANYGVTKLLDQVGSDELETMEKLKIFLTSSMEGSNFDIDSIDDLLDEIDDEP